MLTSEPRARELGLSILRKAHGTVSDLSAVVVFKATGADTKVRHEIGRTFHPEFDDLSRYHAAVYDGLRITATYDGKHFYDATCAYHVDRPICGRRAGAIDHVLHIINETQVKRHGGPGGIFLDKHRYPELVLTVAKIIGVSFVEYRLDADPHAYSISSDLAGLAEAFERWTPRDCVAQPMQF